MARPAQPPAADSLRPAVFLDRDGTLNEERGSCGDPLGVRVLPGVAEALARLRAAGFVLVVVTNQSGVARGHYGEADVARVHWHLQRELGNAVTAWLHCPHHPSEGDGPYRRDCDCRKPAPGLLERAARLLALDLRRSWLVGDAARDLLAGAAAGLRTVLVECGKDPRAERDALRAARCEPDGVCADLPAAAARILAARERVDR
ncbi:MAG: HAD family hydrolase [Planctomycetes bacterium]|nr:HAD family hydrolase [Planctomycetota bacterium]